LVGPVWSAIRAIRKAQHGRETTPLDPSKIPEALRVVLPLASLFSTGEEGLWDHFRAAIDATAQRYIRDTIDTHRDSIDDLVSASPTPMSEEVFALLDLTRMYDYFMYDWDESVPKPTHTSGPPMTAEELEAKHRQVVDIIQRLKNK
jgi:hypothetical protein